MSTHKNKRPHKRRRRDDSDDDDDNSEMMVPTIEVDKSNPSSGEEEEEEDEEFHEENKDKVLVYFSGLGYQKYPGGGLRIFYRMKRTSFDLMSQMLRNVDMGRVVYTPEGRSGEDEELSVHLSDVMASVSYKEDRKLYAAFYSFVRDTLHDGFDEEGVTLKMSA